MRRTADGLLLVEAHALKRIVEFTITENVERVKITQTVPRKSTESCGMTAGEASPDQHGE